MVIFEKLYPPNFHHSHSVNKKKNINKSVNLSKIVQRSNLYCYRIFRFDLEYLSNLLLDMDSSGFYIYNET